MHSVPKGVLIMSTAYAYTRETYPVAQGQDGSIYHRFNFSIGRNGTPEVLTLEGWKSEDQANYAIHIPITKIPDCSPVIASGVQSHGKNEFARAANDAVFQELHTYKATHSTSSTFQAETRPLETLAQKSARLDAFVEQHNETAARRHTKTENFLRAHFAPVGPWVANRVYGNDDAPAANL